MILLFTLALAAWQAPPQPSGHVNDYAGVLAPETVSSLEQLLTRHERETTNQIVVVTVPTLDDRDIADVAYDLGQRWGIGQRGRDNGVLFVVAPREHRMRIEVGKGLEGALTDLQSHVILDDIVRPAFARGDYDRGVAQGTEAIVQAIRGEFRAPTHQPSLSPWLGGAFFLFLLILFLFFPRAGMLLLFMSGRGGGGRRSSFSGGGGSFGGGGASGSW